MRKLSKWDCYGLIERLLSQNTLHFYPLSPLKLQQQKTLNLSKSLFSDLVVAQRLQLTGANGPFIFFKRKENWI